MSQVESTLRRVNGRVLGNRNFRVSCDDDWDPQRHITLRRQLMEQEAREIAATRIPAASVTTITENEDPMDDGFDYEEYRRSQDVSDDPEEFFGAVESGELFDDTGDDYAEEFTDTLPGAVTFDSDRTPAPANEDRQWDGLQDILDAMQDFCHGEIQEHEIHLDGISSTHYYHANRTGIIAVDRFDLYGDRNPPAWWPILECA